MAYYITQGTRFLFEGNGYGGEVFKNLYSIVPGLLEMGEIVFNGAGGSFDQIEVTTLADTEHKYVDGLIADQDSGSNEITFKLLFNPDLFEQLKMLMDAEREGVAASTPDDRLYNSWAIRLQGGSKFTFQADISGLTLDTVGLNDKLTFTMTLAVKETTFTIG